MEARRKRQRIKDEFRKLFDEGESRSKFDHADCQLQTRLVSLNPQFG